MVLGLERVCMSESKTALITGASHGIGAGLVDGFLKQGYDVVATALDVTETVDCLAQPGSHRWRY